MGADLFDSNVASMAAALVMATSLGNAEKNMTMVLCYAAIGLLASIIGVFTANMKEGGDPTKALNTNTYVTTLIYGILTAVATYAFDFNWRIWGASAIGLVVGTVIGIASDYFTNDNKKPVHMVAKACESGPAFTITSGVSYGLLSTLPAMIGIGISALAAYKIVAPLGAAGGNEVSYGMFGKIGRASGRARV